MAFEPEFSIVRLIFAAQQSGGIAGRIRPIIIGPDQGKREDGTGAQRDERAPVLWTAPVPWRFCLGAAGPKIQSAGGLAQSKAAGKQNRSGGNHRQDTATGYRPVEDRCKDKSA